MKLVSSVLKSRIEDVEDHSSQMYEVGKIYVSRLSRFINTKPNNLDSRYYIEEKCDQEEILLKHETGDIYTNIETGERYTLGNPSVVYFDRNYTPYKRYVSPTHLEKFRLKCYYVLREYQISSNKYLTTERFREILDEEDIKLRVLNKGYHY